MQKVIPPGLNYGDIKPEAIENQIRIVKFTPIATIQSAQPNDIVRFHLQGNGFYDPYSAYIRIRVKLTDIAEPDDELQLSGRFLDRSAHSLFSRLVIRSQGTELERIEQYDVAAAMINDMIYSEEQRILHHYEGFAHRCAQSFPMPEQSERQMFPGFLPYIAQGAAQINQTRLGDYGVWKATMGANQDSSDYLSQISVTSSSQVLGVLVSNSEDVYNMGQYRPTNSAQSGDTPLAYDQLGTVFKTPAHASKFLKILGPGAYNSAMPLGVTDNGTPFKMYDQFGYGHDDNDYFAGQITSVRKNGFYKSYIGPAADQSAQEIGLVNRTVTFASKDELEFTLPIYSGIIGVLMPTKKLIPMSLLPLEVEFTMNPHAFYPVGTETTRSYTVTKFEIWSHTMFFEQELHRSLEAAVAESGVFIHYNSFYLAPVNTYNAVPGALPQYNQIGVFLKSINSIHWTFLYNMYEQINGPRKLHFVCHNVSSLQVRNGMDLMPSEPILGQTGGNTISGPGPQNAHAPFMIELYKGWNKMHDPLADASLNSYQYNIDGPLIKPYNYDTFMANATDLGLCQYAISFEGDELGMNKSIISGKKSVMPFDINITAHKSFPETSYMMCFLRADFIIYVRPDLVVTRLGL